MTFQDILIKSTLNPRKLFLIDSLGALLSAFSLGVILVAFESTFGIPRMVLYYLAFFAGIFSLYSFFCYTLFPKNWKPFLGAIAIANLIYCSITLGLMIYLYQKLTILGIVYFMLELIIVVTLATIELKTATYNKA